MQGYTLLTGATGLLGRYLLRDLTVAGHRVAVLLRGRRGASPVERIDALLDLWVGADGARLERPVVLEGDLTRERLGLDDRAHRWIGEHVERWVHGAAIVRFHGRTRDGEPWRTNERGAARAFALCEELGVPEVHHISTAFVAGDREGTILETDVGGRAGFRNHYEESKHLGEEAFRRAEGIPHRTLHRPGIIAGDSRTGYTSTFHGLYVYMRAVSVLLPRLRADADGIRRIPYGPDLPADAHRNLVPVDWVSAVLVRLLGTPEARDRTYHLTPERPVTTRELLTWLGTSDGGGPVELCRPTLRNLSIRHLSKAAAMLRSYETYGAREPIFDTTNLRRFAADLPCPSIDEATVHRYLEYAERMRWGRKRA